LRITFCRESDRGVKRASLYDAVTGDLYAYPVECTTRNRHI
jgi:hypothetical protein